MFAHASTHPLAAAYQAHVDLTLKKLANGSMPPFGMLILELLILGTGRMIFVDPLFQHT